ncbi:undecaprenyldiphospho-muramoylpentapeptide beta-N-acetylglucosaminyltransferase [Labrys wisconsinensis]|uniref:UDP-N-acetylglucosamine--N-acetylmuramyl-(pentapeptide) pyrophosphoryl-undecaprenol N-acetylglucosamine transferase n=1 Tax=Labrys wisconsinensis TaxID=425677 RepID=A0ABU0JBI9_9HYPH|nr:undecaprenyldiphospho-muramoylpentapeptide beta-N-acetylglucosaminyltransferase [Labrys wisconsinensis]MDQ0471634.1 UDP-N-acetylglucosamine--N-acetylmuramyl-(pentapeptide) pyrophosphoryl-undecaprenol N-acetylglucosamine transferase [Labrys wisconsinensis]
MSEKIVLLCAGGTGGHLFPAEALAGALARYGWGVELATDERGAPYTGSFPARKIHAIPAETVRSRSPLAMANTAWKLGSGALAAWRMLGRSRPAVVVGFGGYPTVPPLIAATWRKIPTLIHEQNAVMGRANRLLAGRVTRIATGFPEVAMVEASARAKLVHTGNPVRAAVIEAAKLPYPGFDGRLRLLVLGGSQGARVMSDVVPDAIGRLDPTLRARLSIVQQARREDLARVRQTYADLGIDAEIEAFFKDLPAHMAAAHLVVSRGGASTVAELAAIGRPSILVPLPGALDQDQAANARSLAGTGGAKLVMQTEFTPDNLAGDLAAMLGDPAGLARAAAAARSAGSPDAAGRLAALVVDLAGG